MEDDGGDTNSWADLPPDLTSLILSRIGAIEILENAQRVCRSWRRICKDPWMWRKIDTHYLGGRGLRGFDLDMLCRRAINRSQGGLLEIDLWYFGDNSLLRCISDRASNLKRLKLAFCIHTTCDGLRKAVMNLPLLEDLEVSYGSMWGGEWLRAVGRSCPKMKTLKVNQMSYCYPYESDEEALAIAETMPRLVHLQLFRNTLTNVGLKAVLDNCVNLEHLDLRQCWYVKFVGDIEKRCCEMIKVVRRPDDSTNDYQFDVNDINSFEDEYVRPTYLWDFSDYYDPLLDLYEELWYDDDEDDFVLFCSENLLSHNKKYQKSKLRYAK